VTIPENFSAAATSYAGTASAAQQATIDVSTSPVAGIADTAVGQSVAQAAAIALNQTLTEGYLDQVYLGFNTTGQQFQTVADAAKKLADGSKQLSDGLYQITSNGGLIRTGGSSLVSGISEYTSGASQSATGAAQLASGLSQLSANSAQLRSGVTKLDTGIVTYRAGLVQYTDGATGILSQLPGEIDLLTGIRQLTDQALAGGDHDRVHRQRQWHCPERPSRRLRRSSPRPLRRRFSSEPSTPVPERGSTTPRPRSAAPRRWVLRARMRVSGTPLGCRLPETPARLLSRRRSLLRTPATTR